MFASLTLHSHIFVLLIASTIGLSITVLSWFILRSVLAVPVETRRSTEAPPVIFRWLKWPLQYLVYFIKPYLPAFLRKYYYHLIQGSGLQYALRPEDIVSLQVFSVLVMSLFICILPMPFSLMTVGIDFILMVLAAVYPYLKLKQRFNHRHLLINSSLPFFLDVMTLCVEAGLNIQAAFQQAVLKGPKGPLAEEINHVLRDIRAGQTRAVALQSWAQRSDRAAVYNLVTALVQAETLGMALGPVLRAQSEQIRTARFLNAEKLALEAPVKMLFPLVLFIFPCTFLIIAFPIYIKLMAAFN